MKTNIILLIILITSVLACKNNETQQNVSSERAISSKESEKNETKKIHIYGHIKTDGQEKNPITFSNPNDPNQSLSVTKVQYKRKEDIGYKPGYVYQDNSNISNHKNKTVSIILDPILVQRNDSSYKVQIESHLVATESDWITLKYFESIKEESYNIRISGFSNPILVDNFKLSDRLENKKSYYRIIPHDSILAPPMPRLGSRYHKLQFDTIYYRIPFQVSADSMDSRFVVFENVQVIVEGRIYLIDYIINPITELEY